jgi:hypothetical protein
LQTIQLGVAILTAGLRKLRSGVRKIAAHPNYLGQARPDTPFFAGLYRRSMEALHPVSYWSRRRMAAALASEAEARIDPEVGFLKRDLLSHPAVEAALQSCDSVRSEDDFFEIVDLSRKKCLQSFELDINNPKYGSIFKLACDPVLLSCVCDHMETVPVLHRAIISYSPNEILEGETQLYHMDYEDTKQIKCSIFLEEVTHDTGPLTIISARESREIFEILRQKGQARRRLQYFDDEQIYGAGRVKEGLEITGPRGTVLFADTCNCFHFGSRPGKGPRFLLYFQYSSAFSVEMPVQQLGKAEIPRHLRAEGREGRIAEMVLGLYSSHFARAR